MTRSKWWILGAGLLVAVVLVALPAMVLAGPSSSPGARSGDPKADSPSTPTEQIRVDRRESFRHDGCSKRRERFEASSL